MLSLVLNFEKKTRIGTSLFYAPGLLIGGTVEHECLCSRGISYYLEPLLYFAPFMKQSLEITLKGVTNDPNDLSVTISNFSF